MTPTTRRRAAPPVVLVLVLALAVLALGPTPSARAGLTLLGDEVLSADGRLHELTVRSEALGRETRVRVLLPAGYDDPADATTRYPVLLLVHGANSNERSWTNWTDVEEHTADDDLIVVMPEGGVLGFYSDWLDGPAWETYHLDELLPWIESTYRAVGTREGRAVAGVSMGGFGAMSYAARHPDRFVAVGSFSGVVDFTGLAHAGALVLQLGFAPDGLWGPFLTHEANWRSHNPADIARNLRGVAVHHSTGTGVPCLGDNPVESPIESVILLMNASLDARLTDAGIPHEFVVHPCGTHELRYTDAYFADWLPTLMATLAAPPPPPVSFDHLSAEPRIDVWDWSFTTHRPAVELLDLRAVSPAGLTVMGSGPVDVVTAPAYVPGATYGVSTTGAGTLTLPVGRLPTYGTRPPGPATATTLTADGDGRLAFTVDLGPAHTANQFSPEGILAEASALGSYFRTATVTIEPVAAAPAPVPAPTPSPGPVLTSPSSPTPTGALPATGAATSLWPAAIALAASLGLLGTRRWTRHAREAAAGPQPR